MPKLNFCPECAAPLTAQVINGEPRGQHYCERCAKGVVDHPMIVVTAFVACGKRLLWVQRALQPQQGKWAIPGGFLEEGETLAQGSARELWEEAGVRLSPQQLQLYMVGTITFINQIYVAFRAVVPVEQCQAGVESLDARFFARDECPWDNVAYPQVNDSIRQAYDDLDNGTFDVWEAEMTAAHYALRKVRQSGD